MPAPGDADMGLRINSIGPVGQSSQFVEQIMSEDVMSTSMPSVTVSGSFSQKGSYSHAPPTGGGGGVHLLGGGVQQQAGFPIYPAIRLHTPRRLDTTPR